MRCTCGSELLNPSLPVDRHAWHCDYLNPHRAMDEWTEFVEETKVDRGKKYLWITNDPNKLNNPVNGKIYTYVTQGYSAMAMLDRKDRFDYIYVEDDVYDFNNLYELANTNYPHSKVRRVKSTTVYNLEDSEHTFF